MKTIAILLFIIIVISVLSIIYSIFQLYRIEKAYKIICKWIWDDDPRYEKYTYDYMLNPNKDNWFGLKIPKEKDYK